VATRTAFGKRSRKRESSSSSRPEQRHRSCFCELRCRPYDRRAMLFRFHRPSSGVTLSVLCCASEASVVLCPF
jgi:hypothetical protein